MAKLPRVKIGGDFFLNENGSEFHYVGLSDFGQWKRFNLPSGPDALVRPLLVERRSLADKAGYTGPIVIRVFRYSDPANPFGVLPYSYDFNNINKFLDLCAEYKVYVDWTCGDSQVVLPGSSQQQGHLNTFTSYIQRFCFIETCNEPFKNGINVHAVKPNVSDFYLRDSGDYSEIDYWDYTKDLDFISYHGARDERMSPRFPKWTIDLDDQIGVLRYNIAKPVVLKEPHGFDKHAIPGRRYNDSFLSKILGQRVSMGGVLFHSQLGLESNGFDAEHKEAVGNYFTGVAGALK
jgi:hypothetical protein